MIALLACAAGIPLLDPELGDVDSSATSPSDATETAEDSAEDSAVDTGDSGSSSTAPTGAPTVEGLELACDGAAVRTWWELAGVPADVEIQAHDTRTTWTAHASIDAIDGSTWCGAIDVGTWSCSELDRLTVRISALGSGGEVLACAEIGQDLDGACARPRDPPECQ